MCLFITQLQSLELIIKANSIRDLSIKLGGAEVDHIISFLVKLHFDVRNLNPLNWQNNRVTAERISIL